MPCIKNQSDVIRLVILAPLVCLFALGLDCYIPLVPHLKSLYQVAEETMQMTLSGYMLMCAVAQVMIGPMCDQYGRRIVALYSLMIFLVGTLIALWFHFFTMLLLARLLQAIGASGTFLCAYATVRDLYASAEDSARMYSYMNMCIAQAPIFAPTISGILAQEYGYLIVFELLFGIGVIMLISSYWFYSETVPYRHPIAYAHLRQSYLKVCLNRNFQVYSLASATGMASFFMFFSQSPYIVIGI